MIAHIFYWLKTGVTEWYVGMTGDDLMLTPAMRPVITKLDNHNSANTGSEVVAILGGHTHFDSDFTTPGGIPIIIFDTNSYGTLMPKTVEGQVVRDNARGTIAEQAFDIVTIDYTNRTIKCVRCGRAQDRNFSY